MAGIAVLGERTRVEGLALAGALTCPAERPEEVRAAWSALPGEVMVVILTPAAAAGLGAERDARPGVLTVVMPP